MSAIAASIALTLQPGLAAAQAGSSLKIVVGFAPGGSVDALARQVAETLQTALGRPALVENRTGAAGRLAIEQVKASTPDGDTLLLVPHGPVTLFPHVFKSLKFDMEKDFVPVTRIATGDYALSIGPAAPAKDLAGFIAWAKTAGDKASFGSPGAGTLPHLLGVSVARAIGTTMTHVPYRGSAPAMTDLAGGQIAAVLSPVTEALPLHSAGKIRIIATAGATRSPFLQGVPTLKESGIDIDVPLWFALYAPAATPAATLAKLRTAVVQSLSKPEAAQKMKVLGLVPAPSQPQEQLALQRKESQLWEKAVKLSGFTPED
ncbi:tripartite tricarboxylate transporter substrate-binding protein [Aquabacterium sp.]|uniref:tripartite tricarboxylate transporter substrate-binding protein n=1 Tax=Aquabacterium sp. TaxID=1872578 RepID=UPI003782FCB6